MPVYLLYESAAGYALFQEKKLPKSEQVEGEEMQAAMDDPKTFSNMVHLVAFEKFPTTKIALQEINSVARGMVTDTLENFLETALPNDKSPSKKKVAPQLGVYNTDLGKALAKRGLKIAEGQHIKELLRGCRAHFSHMVKDLIEDDLEKHHLNLGQAYNKKLAFDPNQTRAKSISKAFALLSGLNKGIETFGDSVLRLYSHHFPELAEIIKRPCPEFYSLYAKVARCIRIRDTFDDKGRLEELVKACGGEREVATEIVKAMSSTKGKDIESISLLSMDIFADQVIKLADMSATLLAHLKKTTNLVAPNLCAVVGDLVAAELIAHHGSLMKVAKHPISKAHLQGTEKALFNAGASCTDLVEEKGLHGRFFNKRFFRTVALAKDKEVLNKRVLRYLDVKCSIAARSDCLLQSACFPPDSINIFGKQLRDQMEQRIAASGSALTVHNASQGFEELTGALEVAKKRKTAKNEVQLLPFSGWGGKETKRFPEESYFVEEQHGNRFRYTISDLFPLISFMLAFFGLFRFQSSKKRALGLRVPLMHA